MVLVVPRHEVGVYDYLRRSLAATPGIEVVLDRRVGGPRSEVNIDRRGRGRTDERRILMCALVQRAESAPEPAAAPAREPASPPPAEPDPAAAPAPSEPARKHRTLLWPGLRIDQL